MPRTRSTIAVDLLPSYLRDPSDANLVALALEAQAEKTFDGKTEDMPAALCAAIDAQARKYQGQARETRKFADTLATVHASPNGTS